MYFSANQYYNYLQRKGQLANGGSIHATILSQLGLINQRYNPAGYGSYEYAPTNWATRWPMDRKLVKDFLKHQLNKIANRDPAGVSKWYRPWHVVPELENWSAPVGDYGVGVEIELGFRSIEAARQVANHVKNWKYITLDFEGGAIPIEATFPPTKYSTFGTKSQAVRYVKYLEGNSGLVTPHDGRNRAVGTHVNVSKGGVIDYSQYGSRTNYVNNILENRLSSTQQNKYFGRRPYGYIYNRGRFYEMKLFNSVTDPATLRRYVNIAVSLMELITDTREISTESVVEALERGYNGRIPTSR